MKRSFAPELLGYFQGHLEEMVELLKTLALIESPSLDANAQQPLFDIFTQQFSEVELKPRIIKGRNSGGQFFARPRVHDRRKSYQLLLGHCDTVWPKEMLKEMPLVEENGILKGPGVYDMKAGLTQMIFALRAMQELHLKPMVEPVVFINTDEEIGSRESTRYIRMLAKSADRAFVLEPSLGLQGKLKTGRKGVGRFTVRVKGKAAHAGLDPESGASAILELSHVIQTLFALNDPAQGITVNVGTIDGGLRANVIAPESSAVVDVRVLNHEDALEIEKTILNIQPVTPGVALKIEGSIGRPPMEHTPANRVLWELATELAGEVDLQLAEGTAGGGSDGNTTSLYTATLDGMGAVGDGAHARHEFVDTGQLPERTALLALLLLAPPLNLKT